MKIVDIETPISAEKIQNDAWACRHAHVLDPGTDVEYEAQRRQNDHPAQGRREQGVAEIGEYQAMARPPPAPNVAQPIA